MWTWNQFSLTCTCPTVPCVSSMTRTLVRPNSVYTVWYISGTWWWHHTLINICKMCEAFVKEIFRDVILRAHYPKHPSRVLKRDLNKSHFIPETQLLKRCKTANLNRALSWARSSCLETRLRSAVLHRLRNRISDITCDSFKSLLKTWFKCFE